MNSITYRVQQVSKPTDDPQRPADWLPWFMGYRDAVHQIKPQPKRGTAKEYFQGLEYGRKVKTGQATVPNWIKEEV